MSILFLFLSFLTYALSCTTDSDCPVSTVVCKNYYCATNGSCALQTVCDCGDGNVESPYEECDNPVDSFCSSQCELLGVCIQSGVCQNWYTRKTCPPYGTFVARTHCSQNYTCCERGECLLLRPAECNGTIIAQSICLPETCLIGACCTAKLIGTEYQRCHPVYTEGECSDLDGWINRTSINCPDACVISPGACLRQDNMCINVDNQSSCDGEWHLLERCPVERFCNTNLYLFWYHLLFNLTIIFVVTTLYFLGFLLDKRVSKSKHE